MLAKISPLIDCWYVCDLPTPRAATAAALQSQIEARLVMEKKRLHTPSVSLHSTPQAGLNAALLAADPGKVFSREMLLSRVWGYEYYGGARTVDVHIRRLRAKLGEEHANLIQTVRSVGYRFGQSRWGS